MMPFLKKPSMYSVASCICGVSRVQLPSSSISETPDEKNAHRVPCQESAPDGEIYMPFSTPSTCLTSSAICLSSSSVSGA